MPEASSRLDAPVSSRINASLPLMTAGRRGIPIVVVEGAVKAQRAGIGATTKIRTGGDVLLRRRQAQPIGSGSGFGSKLEKSGQSRRMSLAQALCPKGFPFPISRYERTGRRKAGPKADQGDLASLLLRMP
nr:hypothetical protein [Stenotrophomonas pavanii]